MLGMYILEMSQNQEKCLKTILSLYWEPYTWKDIMLK